MAVNLFDVGYYREVNPDLAAAGLTTDEQLTNHFFTSGINEDRLFSRFVDLNFYSASNPDVAAAFGSARVGLYTHLANNGVSEGRRFSPFFDLSFYQTANPDLATAGIATNEQLFDHYQAFGINDGRRASAIVDMGFYQYANGDLASLGNAQLLDHLRRFGITEERRFSPVVDLGIYEAANPDIKAANFSNTALLQHIGTNGIFEGRRLSLSYNPVFYANNNPDLAAVGLNSQQLLNHFEFSGLNEGRQASDYFNVNVYRANNPDLGLNGIVTNQQALDHFETYGFNEGRLPGNTPFAIPTGTTPGHNNFNLATAANLGTFNNIRSGTISERIDSSDLSNNFLNDIYRVLIPTTSDVNISISGTSRPLTLQIIFDRNGNNVNDGGTDEEIFSRSNNTTSPAFSRTLGQGTYYVRVFTADLTTNVNYTLGFSATTIPMIPARPDPGETANTALNLGTLTGNVIGLQNFVGVADPSDFYRFNVATPSTLNLTIGNFNLVSNVDRPNLEIYFDANNNNQIDDDELNESRSAISAPLTLSKPLAAGSYFLKIQQNSIFVAASNTRYSLNLSAA